MILKQFQTLFAYVPQNLDWSSEVAEQQRWCLLMCSIYLSLQAALKASFDPHNLILILYFGMICSWQMDLYWFCAFLQTTRKRSCHISVQKFITTPLTRSITACLKEKDGPALKSHGFRRKRNAVPLGEASSL